MTAIAGKTGNVFVASLLLENCEDDWQDGTHGSSDLEETIVKVGDGSVKITGSSVENGNILAYEALASSTDVSSYTHILCWAWCSSTIAAADLRLALDDTDACASPESLVDLPALTADTWKYCHCTEVTGSTLDDSSAADYIGLEWNANAQDKIVYLDDIRAAKNVAGIRSWSLDYTTDPLETTDFGDAGVRSYIAGPSGWAGTFEGFKDGAPLTIGSQYGLELAESATVTQMWLGNAIITGLHPSVAYDGVVTYSYDFTGTGVLTIASTSWKVR